MKIIKKPHGIMFHYFHDEQKHIKGQGSLSGCDLTELLLYYKQKYNIISAEEWFVKYIKDRLAENDVCLTFDDALKCQYDVAKSVLEKMNLTAFWFIYTSPLMGGSDSLEVYRHFRCSIFKDMDEFYKEFFYMAVINSEVLRCDIKNILETFNAKEFLPECKFYTENDRRFRFLRDQILEQEQYDFLMTQLMKKYNYNAEQKKQLFWLSRKDIRQLSETGHFIGLHSHTHQTIMGTKSYMEQREEYLLNKDILESVINRKIFTASYPCNSYNEDTLRIMKELGIQLAFRADMEKDFLAPFEVPREDSANILRRMRTAG